MPERRALGIRRPPCVRRATLRRVTGSGATVPVPNHPLRWLPLVSISEGVSWLVLIGACGLKYGLGWPWGVRVVGMIHGVLFLLLLWLLVRARIECRWSARRLGTVLLASFVPGRPFVLDPHLRQWAAEPRPNG